MADFKFRVVTEFSTHLSIPPTLTRFDYFRIFKRTSESAQYLAKFPALVGRISDEHARRREAEQRRRAMRDLV